MKVSGTVNCTLTVFSSLFFPPVRQRKGLAVNKRVNTPWNYQISIFLGIVVFRIFSQQLFTVALQKCRPCAAGNHKLKIQNKSVRMSSCGSYSSIRSKLFNNYHQTFGVLLICTQKCLKMSWPSANYSSFVHWYNLCPNYWAIATENRRLHQLVSLNIYSTYHAYLSVRFNKLVEL